jgi:hypothetical protein
VRETMRALCFWACVTSLTMMSSNRNHLLSNCMSLFLMAE